MAITTKPRSARSRGKRKPVRDKEARSSLAGEVKQPGWVRGLRSRLGVTRKTFARLLSVSERSLADFENGKAVSDAMRRRLTEVDRLQQALAAAVSPEVIGEWLLAPNPAFDGFKPLELIERGQIDRLWHMVHHLESGVPT